MIDIDMLMQGDPEPLPELGYECDNGPTNLVDHGIEEFFIQNGLLYINGAAIPAHRRGDYISFSRIHNGKPQYGFLQMHCGGLALTGTIHGDAAPAAVHIRGSSQYDTHYYPHGDDGVQEEWLRINIGAKKNKQGAYMPTAWLSSSPNSSFGQDVEGLLCDSDSSPVVASVSPGTGQSAGLLGLQCNFDDMLEDPPFAGFSVLFDTTFRTADGGVWLYDNTQEGHRGKTYKLKAEFVRIVPVVPESLSSSNFMHPHAPAHLVAEAAGLPVLGVVDFARLAQAHISAEALDVNELLSMPAPNQTKVQEDSFAKLKNMMLATIDKEMLEKFGETPPELDAETEKVCKSEKVQAFLKDQFGVAYLTQAYSTSDDAEIKRIFESVPDAKKRLKAFWNGASDTSMSRSDGFLIASSHSLKLAYIEAIPRLRDYMNNDSAKWGKKLFEASTDPMFLNGLALTTQSDMQKRVHHIATMLQAFDESAQVEFEITTKEGKVQKETISYARAFYRAVFDRRLQDFSNYSRVPDGESDVLELLEAFYAAFLQLVSDGGESQLTPKARQELQKMLLEAKQEAAAISADHFSNSMRDFLGNVTKLMTQFSFGKFGPVQNVIKSLVKQQFNPETFPKMNKWASATVTIVGVLGGVYSTVGLVRDWAKLTSTQRINGVLTIMQSFAVSISTAVEQRLAFLLADKTLSSSELRSAVKVVNAARRGQSITRTLLNIEQEFQGSLIFGTREDSLIISAVGAMDHTNQVSRWARAAKYAEKSVGLLMALMYGMATYSAAEQVLYDFKIGESALIVSVDILKTLLNFSGLVFELAGVFFPYVEFVAVSLPYIGAAIAIVIIVVSIVDLFLGRKQPPSPIARYVEEHCKPFLEKLPVPADDSKNRLTAAYAMA